MNIDNLIRMANRIGDFFDAMPDRREALADIAGHIDRYWAPRMRSQLAAHVKEQGGAGLSATVLEALRGQLAPGAGSGEAGRSTPSVD